MAVKIRLRRMGSLKRPFYRLVAADSRFQRDGRFLETIGYYDPMEKPYRLQVDREKAMQWLNKGAQMTETVKSLLRKEGIVQEFNLKKTSAQSSTKSEKKPKEDSSSDEEVSKDTEK